MTRFGWPISTERMLTAIRGVLFGEYGSQSLMGGRRVIVVKDADNNHD